MRRLFMAKRKNHRIDRKIWLSSNGSSRSYWATLRNDKSVNKQGKYRIARLKT